MTPEEMIRRELNKCGMTMAAASRRSGVKYSTLQSALAGRTKLNAYAYLSLCLLLNVDPRAYQTAQTSMS